MEFNKEQELELTLELIKALRNTQGLTDIVDILTQFFSKNFMFQYGFGYLIKTEKEGLRAQLVCNFPPDEQVLLSQSGDFSLYSFSNANKDFFVNKNLKFFTQNPMLQSFYEAAGFLLTEDIVSIPLFYKTEQVACLHLVKLKGHSDLLTADIETDIEFMHELIQHIQPFIENTLQFMNVMKDDSTDIYNRKYFFLNLDKSFQRCQLNKSPLTLILANIDGLGEINKEYGYQIGNYAINYTASLLKTSLRGFDILAKLEGNTFGILTAQNAEVSQKISQRIQDLFQNNSLSLPNNKNLDIRLSLAVNSKHYDSSKSLEFYEKTEDLLTTAKKNGGNQMVII